MKDNLNIIPGLYVEKNGDYLEYWVDEKGSIFFFYDIEVDGSWICESSHTLKTFERLVEVGEMVFVM